MDAQEILTAPDPNRFAQAASKMLSNNTMIKGVLQHAHCVDILQPAGAAAGSANHNASSMQR